MMVRLLSTRLWNRFAKKSQQRRPAKPRRLSFRIDALERREVPATFVVTNLLDGPVANANDLPGSLRQAIFDANAAPGADTIDLTGVSGTINLSEGELEVLSDMAFTGPGAGVLAISGNQMSRVFRITNDDASAITVSMSGLTITGGQVADDHGAGMIVGNEKLSLNNMVIAGNRINGVFGTGGGIMMGIDGGASLTINNTTIADNRSPNGGGGIYFQFPNFNGHQLSITNSTISGNVAGQRGGGIYFSGGGYASSSFLMRNATVSGNTSQDGFGGGLIISATSYVPMKIYNSTITGNRALAAPGGGGIALNYGFGTLDLQSSIVAGNTGAANAPDFFTNSFNKIDSKNNLIGSLSGIGNVGVFFNDLGGTLIGAANLGPLANNGGPTRTHMPLPGSLALNNGLNPTPTVSFDQRGSGFPRQIGSAVDIGAVEVDPTKPLANATTNNVTTPGGTTYTFTVTYTDDVAIKFSTIGNGDVRVIGPNGFDVPATFISATPMADGSPIVATYSITPPDGSWDYTDNGQYSVVLQPNQVTDTGNVAIATDVIGNFQVAIGRMLVVTTIADSGPGSFRDAVEQANLNVDVTDTITFDTVQMGSTIIGMSAAQEYLVTDPVVITSAVPVTLDGLKLARIMRIDGPGAMSVTIDGLTFANGLVDSTGLGGAGIAFANEHLTLLNCEFINNSTGDGMAFPGGAGGAVLGYGFGGGSLTIFGCEFTGNNTGGGNVFNRGGAVSTGGFGTNYDVVIRYSSFINNKSLIGDGGALHFGTGSLLIENSTFANNEAGSRGGAIAGNGYMNANGFNIVNTTISGNKSFSSGGGLYLGYLSSNANFLNVTVTNNKNVDISGQFPGGGIAMGTSFGGSLNLINTVVAGNFNVVRSDIAASGNVLAQNSLIGNASNINVVGMNNITGTKSSPVNPFLAPLANNGGPTLTHKPYGGSPLIDAGPATSTLTFDQRGPGYPRVLNGKVDIGAIEADPNIPSATTTLTKISTTGGTVYTITVTYADNVAIDVSTIDNNDIRVVGPNGFDVMATLKSVTPGGNGTPRVATYEFTPPGGFWNGADNGLYTVFIEPNQVSDTSGNFVEAHALGAFRCAIPLHLVVTNANDSGPGSLRAALELANNNLDVLDTITFDTGFFATPRTIVLTSGELLIGDTVIINNATGAKNVTLQGVNSRIFTIDTEDVGAAVTISGLTMTKGTGQGSGQFLHAVSGGAIMNQDEALTLTGCVIVGNSALDSSNFNSPYGGGIHLANLAASLVMTDCVVTGNVAYVGGGGISSFYNSVITISNSTISNNRTGAGLGSGGGIYLNNGGTLAIDNSLIADNFASASGSFGGGGGIALEGVGTATITNSTITGNSTNANGGGVQVGSFTTTIRNSTVVNNAARHLGGGLFVSGYYGALTLTSTIVASNKNSYAPDLETRDQSNVVTADNSLIGVLQDVTITGSNNLTGTLLAPLNPLLGPLTNNGGPTATMMPLPGSPAINAGSNPGMLATDQRGPGFARTLGSATDIGAVEVNPATPTASGIFPTVTKAGGTIYQFTITYTDDTAINVGTLGNNNIRVTGPGGFNVLAQFVGVDVPSNGSPRVATYQFTPPGGMWTDSANGLYSISIEPNQVADTGGAFVPAAVVNTLFVGIARTFVVTNDQDSGAGSLRDAIAQANANAGITDIITFDPVFFATPKTITLSGSELRITDPVTITGPGAALVTIDGNFQSRVFSIDLAAPQWGHVVTMKGLTIANGEFIDGGGAGISNQSATLQIDNCVLSGHKSSFYSGGALTIESIYAHTTITNSLLTQNQAYRGGAVYISGGIAEYLNSATVTIINSTLSNNSTSFFGSGGAIMIDAGGGATIENSTLKGNVADNSGGAIFVDGEGSLTITGSTLSGNESKNQFGGGGGIFFAGNSFGTITNSTLSGNLAANGGAIATYFFDGLLRIRNTTIAFNNVADDAGGIGFFGGNGTVEIESSIVANNTATTGPDLFSLSPAQKFNVDFSLIGKTDDSTVSGANNKNGTIASPVDPMLDLTLANNGGPTQTHKLLPGSPAVNTGSNPAGLTFDQRGPGFLRTSGGGTDMGAFEIQAAVAPPTASIKVGTGDPQRSMVTSFTVTFSETVMFPDGPAAAFQLIRTGPGGPTGSVNLAFNVSGNTVTITFNDPIFAPQIGLYNSLIDGKYTLTLVANKIIGAGGPLDGDGNGTGGDNQTLLTHRLFGDADGNGSVTATDFNAFRLQYGSTGPSIFDYNGDNQVAAIDFNEFRLRYGTSI
jgi:hypothetical protein